MIGPQGIPGPIGIPGPQGNPTDIGPTFYVTGVISTQAYTADGVLIRYPAENFTIVSDNPPPNIDGLHIQPDFSILGPSVEYFGLKPGYPNPLIALPLPNTNRYKFIGTLDHLDITGEGFSEVPYLGIYIYMLDMDVVVSRTLLNRSLVSSTFDVENYTIVPVGTVVVEVEADIDEQYTHVGIELVLSTPAGINPSPSSRRITFMGTQSSIS